MLTTVHTVDQNLLKEVKTMFKFIKKLRENISFYRWAYANRKTINQPVNAYIKVNNIEPKLIQCVNIVGNGELIQYEPHVRKRLLEQVMNELDKTLVMEKVDLINGTSRVEIKFYISSFVEEQ